VSDALRAEWLKLRTVRANVVVVLCAIGGPLLLSVLLAAFVDSGLEDTFAVVVLVPASITAYMAGVIGVLGIGQEYRHNTIRVTFAAQPRRSTVLAAKSTVSGLFGLGLGLITPILCFGLGGLVLKARDIDISLFDPSENATALLGLALFTSVTTLMGFGLGCILRQPAGAIPAILLWPLIVESILAAILDAVAEGSQKWLPFQAGTRMAATGFVEDSLSRFWAGVYFGLWTAAIVAIGWWLAERRDA
jgi:ABC-type transport system involved in multi-copper enzyme maturation permease subunit